MAIRPTIIAVGLIGLGWTVNADPAWQHAARRPSRETRKAQFVLAGLYTFGDGVAKDDAEAARWYRKAAEQGHVLHSSCLEVCTQAVKGVRMDDGEAVLWWRKAAEQGFADAQFKLGLMYGVGEGVPKDEVQAYAWMNLAAAQEHESAREIRAGFSGHMSRDEIAEAQKLSRELAD